MYKVLIVEDEDVIRKGPMSMADQQQAGCVIAGEIADGLEGLEKIRGTRSDIVIVDINVPVMDGLEMLERSIWEYGFDVIIVSGYNESEYARGAITPGVTEYLLKPVNSNELCDAPGKIIQEQMATAKLWGEMRRIDIERKKLGTLDSLPPEELAEGNPYVEFMMDYIREHYYSRVLLTDVSKQCGMSCTYLSAKFKSGTGYTFNNFPNCYQMQRVVEFLRENKYKVYKIADLMGPSGYKYFIKAFKKYIGRPPVCFIESGGNPPE